MEGKNANTVMEERYCPYICHNHGRGPLSRCNIGEVEPITNCKFYSEKEKCWKEFHETNG